MAAVWPRLVSTNLNAVLAAVSWPAAAAAAPPPGSAVSQYVEVIPSATGGTVPALLFGLLLIGMLGGLAYANVVAVRRRR